MTQTPQISKADLAHLKRKEVVYCVDGYHSFKSVEHQGFTDLLQTGVSFGAKYGKFEVRNAMYMRKAVSCETSAMASDVKKCLTERLKPMSEDGTVALTIDLYTDDFRKKSYLDIHASWIERDFRMYHTALAVKHFGVSSHTADNISEVVSGILQDYGLPEEDTPATTDHGSNIVAA